MKSPDHIEDLVQKRLTEKARREIRSYLRLNKGKEAALLQALEWFRRLGLYADGYRLATHGLKLRPIWDTQKNDGKRVLWAARFLYLMGATRFSYQLTGMLKLHSARDFHYAAEMCLADCIWIRALELYSRSIELETAPRSREALICRLGYADTLSGLGRYSEAILQAQEVGRLAEDDRLKQICLSCEGEYEARAGNYAKARVLLEKALPTLMDIDPSVDRAVHVKWLGYVLHRLGRHSEGLAYLKESREIFRALRIREDATLDVIRLENELGVLSPGVRDRLVHFPGLAPGFQAVLPQAKETEIGDEKAELLIDLSSSEFRDVEGWRATLPVEFRLLAWLRIAEDWGLNSMRAIALLWTDEVFSILQLEGRLQQLIGRLKREFGFNVSVDGKSIFLDPKDYRRVRVHVGGSHLPRIFREKSRVSASDLSKFYRLSRSQSYSHLKKWVSSGLVRKDGNYYTFCR